jgi:hypothetical protein
MKTRLFLFCSLLLVPMVALPKDKPVKVYISSGTRPASARGETKLVADWFEGQVLKGIMDKYPCAQVTTASALKEVLEWNRQRELLDSGSGTDLQTLGEALGVNYIISLTVTEMGSGKLTLNASMASGTNGSTQATGMDVTDGGEAALDAAEAAANKFVDGLSSLKKFSKEYCNPTNLWTGTITFRRTQNNENKSERKAISGEGTITNTATRTLNHDVTITLPWTGFPRASITANESRRFEELAVVKINCGGVGIARKGVWKSAGWNHLTRMDRYAGASGEAKVSVTIAKGKYEVSVSLPNIEGTEESTKIEHGDGGCGKPSDNTPAPFKERWNAKVDLLEIKAPLRKPDELQGSDSDELGGIISWNLTRTPKKN